VQKITQTTSLLNWNLFLENQCLGSRTIEEYTKLLITLPSEINKDSLTKWISKHNNHVARAVLKKYIDFLETSECDSETLTILLAFKIPKIRGRRKKKKIRILTRNEVEELAYSCKDKRAEIMILTTFFLGLRKKELLGLRFKDINWKSYTVKISSDSAKGKKERILPMPAVLGNSLVAYFDHFQKKILDTAQKENLRIFNRSYQWFYDVLARNSFKLFGYTINPHALRHACGTYLKEKGLDLQEIAAFLGHENIETTKIYAHLSKELLKKRIDFAFDD